MKTLTALILIVSLVITVASCGKRQTGSTTSFSTDAITTAPTTFEESSLQSSSESSSAESSESTPQPSPMKIVEKSQKSYYGKNTGTDKTYTGLEPLPATEFPVVDPDNLRGIPTAEYNHSFGVSKDGKPHEISVNNQAFYEKYGGICLDTSGEKVIYLTFDCGYENGCTAQILDTLKEKGVPAAFFVTLPNVKDNPEIIARMINEGHVVGNHSDTHPNFSTLTRSEMVKEIEALDNYLREKFGYSSPYFRFPEGACSENALELVQSIGYTSVFWSSAYADWDINNPKGKEYAYDTVTSRLHPGCVLLLHAVSPDNAAALGDIIDYAHSQGYTFKAL